MTNLMTIHQIKRMGKYFLFDENSGSFFEIAKSLFEFIEKNKQCKTTSKMYIQEINNRLKVLNSRPKKNKSNEQPRTCRFRLEISNQCNNRCRYCHVFQLNDKASQDRIEYNQAKKHIQEYLELSKRHVNPSTYYLNFYGGEPLLEWDTVHRLIKDYGSEYEGKKIFWGINTNSRLLNEDIALFCRDYEVALHIGCDGDEAINDKLRISSTGEGTFKNIQKSLDIINKHGIKKQLDCVISNININHLDSIIDVAKRNSVENIYLDLMYKPYSLLNIDKTVHVYRNAVSYGKENGVTVGGCCTNILDRIKKQRRYFPASKENMLRSLYISVDNGLYPALCKAQPVSHSSIKEYFSLSNNQWESDYRTIKEHFSAICSDCFLRQYCYFSGVVQYQYHTKLDKGYEDSCKYLKEYILTELIDEKITK